MLKSFYFKKKSKIHAPKNCMEDLFIFYCPIPVFLEITAHYLRVFKHKEEQLKNGLNSWIREKFIKK